MIIKKNSTYQRKNGVVMKQLNIAIKKDEAEKFDILCRGISRSAILTQWIQEKWKKQING